MSTRPPNFFVVGAARSGTTSLCRCLEQHRSVFFSPIKEPCFFAPEVVAYSDDTRARYAADAPALRAYLDGPLRDRRGVGFVLEWEEYLKLFKNVAAETAIGEGSVAYLGSLSAPAMIRARVPDARIVMLLRDPVDRLYSNYAGAVATGATSLTFLRWVDRCLEIEAARQLDRGPVWIGRYACHLQRYLASFVPHQICVQLYDDYVRSPDTVCRNLLAFLAVDPGCHLDVGQRHNVTLVPRWPALHRWLKPVTRTVRAVVPSQVANRLNRVSRVPSKACATSEERAEVIRIYERDIRTLQALLDRDLSAWLSPERSARVSA